MLHACAVPSKWAWLTRAGLAASVLNGHGRLHVVLTCPGHRQGPLWGVVTGCMSGRRNSLRGSCAQGCEVSQTLLPP